MKKALAARVLDRSGLRSLLGRAARWSGVLVLNYHRVGDGSRSTYDRGLERADAESFAEQVRFCKAESDVISPDDLPRVVAKGRGRYLLITFDDGYRDNYEAAFPILKAVGVPATFFVTAGFVDSGQLPWWDEIAWMVRTSRRDRVELRDWIKSPVQFDEPDREGAIRTLLRAYKALPGSSTGRYLDALAEATDSGGSDPDATRDLWMTWDMMREMRRRDVHRRAHSDSSNPGPVSL